MNNKITEKQWNEICPDIYHLISPISIEQGKTEEEIKKLMNGIKDILMEDDELIASK
jgi:hypothetical protein